MKSMRQRECVVAIAGVVAACVMFIGCGSGQRASRGMDPVAAIVEMLRGDSAAQLARDALNTYDADRRREAVVRLANADYGGDEPFVRLYRLLLDDPDPTVRAAAVMALGEHAPPGDALMIAAMLEDDSAYVRWEAAKALQKIHHPGVAPELSTALNNDEDADVRMAAAEALGQYADAAVFQTLVSALSDRNRGVVRAANESLRTLTGQDLDADAAQWLALSRERGPRLFADQRPYRYRMYAAPPGWMGRVLLRQDHQPAEQSPRGLEQ
jgi:HEAT repeat protein